MIYQNTNNEIFNLPNLKESSVVAKELGLTKLTDEQVEAYNNKPLVGTWNGNEWIVDNDKIAEVERQRLYENWKAERQNKVDNLEVTYNGVVYQGDEVSQTRMARAVSVMNDIETTEWVAKDNSIQVLNKADLSAILKQAGIRQTEIWNEGRPS